MHLRSALVYREPARARYCAVASISQATIHPTLTRPPHRRAMNTVRRFIADETAATAIEYGLIAAGIAIAIITAVKGLGTKLSSNFNTISTSLK